MMTPKPLRPGLVWEVTARCNQRCRFCYNIWTAPGATAPRDVTFEEAREIIERVACFSPRLGYLQITGGEPLIRDDLEGIAALARCRLPRTQLSIATNGRLLSRQRAMALKGAGVAVLQLTLLSARPEIHDGLAGFPGSHRYATEAIVNAKSAGLKVASFFVATSENIDGWPGASKLALALGADALVFNRFQPGGRGLHVREALTPQPDQLARAMDHARTLQRLASVNMGTIVPPCELPGRRRPMPGLRFMSCPWNGKHAYPTISPDATVRPCNHTPITLGSLLEEPLERVLQRPGAEKPAVREVAPECANCSKLAVCGGGCLAARMLAKEAIYGAPAHERPAPLRTAASGATII